MLIIGQTFILLHNFEQIKQNMLIIGQPFVLLHNFFHSKENDEHSDIF